MSRIQKRNPEVLKIRPEPFTIAMSLEQDGVYDIEAAVVNNISLESSAGGLHGQFNEAKMLSETDLQKDYTVGHLSVDI